MSRIGQQPVKIPSGVTVKQDGQTITAKGSVDELSMTLIDDVTAEISDDEITLAPANDSDFARQIWGTSRTLVANMIEGVSNGFKKHLEITGIGYRAKKKGSNKLELQLGFSHDVEFDIPDGIEVELPNQTEIIIKGADKQLVGQTAAEIKRWRPPEPYKGKGIRIDDEWILRKEGKKK
jgi:large subunit ribosomal protein L6